MLTNATGFSFLDDDASDTKQRASVTNRFAVVDTASDALAYANTGVAILPVFPMRDGICACPRGAACNKNAGKHPIGAFAPHGAHSGTRDPDTIKRWWGAWELPKIISGKRGRASPSSSLTCSARATRCTARGA
jgi:hypothetical protein